MRSYKVIVSKEALSDLDSIAAYVAGLYRPSSGHNVPHLGRLCNCGQNHSLQNDDIKSIDTP